MVLEDIVTQVKPAAEANIVVTQEIPAAPTVVPHQGVSAAAMGVIVQWVSMTCHDWISAVIKLSRVEVPIVRSQAGW